MNSKLLIAVLLVFCGLALCGAKKKVVCYFGSWSVYRQGLGNFPIEGIDPKLCTHLIYCYVGINPDGSIRIIDQNSEIDKGGFKKFNALKSQNPKVKTLVSIGGYNEGSSRFSIVAAQAYLRTAFVNNAANFVKTYGFDGLDLAWEYPSRGEGSSPNDKANFALLIKEFREVFDKQNLLISAAVGATATAIGLSYDVPALSKYLHFINIMAYDLHGAYDGATGENAPLYASPVDVTDYQKELNVDAVLKAWISKGALPTKLVLGIGAYGRSYTLSDPSDHGIGAASYAPGRPGPYTLEPGMLGYNEICELQKNGQWNIVWNEKQKVPYAYSGDQWVGYDNPKSVGLKVAHGNKLNLGGYMIWSIETDDFRGICGAKYPILTTINKGL